MKVCITIITLFFTCNVFAQQANESIQLGNEYFRQGNYGAAEAQYRKALKLEPNNNTAKYNLANTMYKEGKLDEATRNFSAVAADSRDPLLKSKAHYNKGVILSGQKKLEESIEAYKNALRQNPDDTEARENLQKALLELKKKQPEKNDQDKKKNKQDQQQQKQQPQPKMNKKEAEQKLKMLDQKEKEVQERLQKEKSKTGGSRTKDW
jgi:Ca-activated chloride channel homolog